jgi:molybdate transport system substrate-binding protein
MRRTAIVGLLGAGLVTAGGVAGCAPPDAGERTVTVLAAASLTEAFTDIVAAFEGAQPGIDVEVSFGPSSGLVAQVAEGAEADIIATANETTMAAAVDAGIVATPDIFATNSLAVAVPASNPAGISDISDLASPEVLVAACQPRVPCGTAAAEVIDASGLSIAPVTYEVDVKAVLTKVLLDEVDAGFVYATDIAAAGSAVARIDIPAAFAATVTYPVALTLGSGESAAAQAFIDFVLGEQGQRILREYGFGSGR